MYPGNVLGKEPSTTNVEVEIEQGNPASLEEPAVPSNLRPDPRVTSLGTTMFDNLVLPSPSPTYRPYVILDAEKKSEKSKSRQSKGKVKV